MRIPTTANLARRLLLLCVLLPAVTALFGGFGGPDYDDDDGDDGGSDRGDNDRNRGGGGEVAHRTRTTTSSSSTLRMVTPATPTSSIRPTSSFARQLRTTSGDRAATHTPSSTEAVAGALRPTTTNSSDHQQDATLSPLFAQYGPYGYIPLFWPGILFASLFTCTAIAHIIQMVMTRSHRMTFVVLACLMEIGGHTLRTMGHLHPRDVTSFVVMKAVLLSAPSLVALSQSVTLVQILGTFRGRYTLLGIRDTVLFPVFLISGLAAMAIQIGGSISAARDQADGNDTDFHVLVLIIGLCLQISSYILIGILVLTFCLKVKLSPPDSEQWEREREALMAVRFNLYILAFAVSCLLIMLRCIYRFIELYQGWYAPISTIEWEFYAFDAFPVFVAILLLNVCHPDYILRRCIDATGAGQPSCDEYMIPKEDTSWKQRASQRSSFWGGRPSMSGQRQQQFSAQQTSYPNYAPVSWSAADHTSHHAGPAASSLQLQEYSQPLVHRRASVSQAPASYWPEPPMEYVVDRPQLTYHGDSMTASPRHPGLSTGRSSHRSHDEMMRRPPLPLQVGAHRSGGSSTSSASLDCPSLLVVPKAPFSQPYLPSSGSNTPVTLKSSMYEGYVNCNNRWPPSPVGPGPSPSRYISSDSSLPSADIPSTPISVYGGLQTRSSPSWTPSWVQGEASPRKENQLRLATGQDDVNVQPSLTAPREQWPMKGFQLVDPQAPTLQVIGARPGSGVGKWLQQNQQMVMMMTKSPSMSRQRGSRGGGLTIDVHGWAQ